MLHKTHLNETKQADELNETQTQAPFTLVRFRFKTHNFATVTPIVYTTPVFSRSKTETFENAADPVLV